MNNRIAITCLVILLSACLLVGLIALLGVGVYSWGKLNPPATITSAAINTIQPETTDCPATSCLAPTPGASIPTAELPESISKVMDKIQTQVIEIRGLHPSADIPRAILSPNQLRQNVIEDFLADYTPEDAQMDAISLSILGLLPSNFDLLTFYEDLYSEQIAGYYDDETKEMYIVSGSGFGGPEKMTYAHEFTHILQDQTYDFENGLKMGDEDCKADSERCAAVSALIEGDASLTEYLWYFQYSTKQDQGDVNSFYQSLKSPVYDSAPEFMKEDFLFPYSAGQEFVQVLYDRGGWRAVDNVYANPPISTEQIMHPSRYPDDTPIKIDLPDLTSELGEGWKQIETDVMGEWYTYLVLAKGDQVKTQLDDETARKSAEGWGGDVFQVYYNAVTEQTLFIMKSTWDSNRDSREFYDAFTQYGDARWGSSESQDSNQTGWKTQNQAALIQIDASSTVLVIAPGSAILDGILSALAGQ